jgi:hypothetical protein
LSTKTRPRRDKDQVAPLHSAEQRIDIHKACADASNQAGPGRVDAGCLQVLLQELADVNEVPEAVAAAEG